MQDKLLEFDEMVNRHKQGEDPFELAIEKWVRIRDYLLKKANPERYKEAFHCGCTKILFCVDYKDRCPFCPLEKICFDGQSLYYQVMRSLQVYSLAGAVLPRGPLIELIDCYIQDLNGYKDSWIRKSN
ncbi:MAG TPA: hypothetical protein VLS90_07595 [Thermodesulfobacteriota bacterium]|nr:hypothetical protein [Thermodesulfobacteriota bacterium]